MKFLSWEIIIPSFIGIIMLTAVLTFFITSNSLSQGPSNSTLPKATPKSLAIEMSNDVYRIGDQLNFTIVTKGVCEIPDLQIMRNENEASIIIFQYTGSGAVKCPPTESPEERVFRWSSERLVSILGNEKDSSITRKTASLTFGKAGNYTIHTNLLDWSQEASMDFIVLPMISEVIIPKGAANPSTTKTLDPATIDVTIGVNNTVRWINNDTVPHSVVSDIEYIDNNTGKKFDLSTETKDGGFIMPGRYYEFTFTEPGTYGYHGEPHPWIRGTVIVHEDFR